MLIDTSIIILTKNGGANFPRLLERIYSQQYKGGYEVIVIDSGSTDGTLEATRKYPVLLKEIPPQQFHHSKTRNLGAELARGKYIVYITQDALPLDDNWLRTLTDNFDDPQVAMVVGRQIPWESTRPPEKFFYHYYFPAFRITLKNSGVGHYHDCVFISDVNSAYRKDILLKYRFAENMVMAEDKETAARMLAGGGTIIYEPAAVVYHSHNFGIKSAYERSLDTGLAIKQGSPILPRSNKRADQRLMNYLGAEIRFLNSNGFNHWIPYSLLYEIVRYTGYFLGRYCGVPGPVGRISP